MRSLLGPLVIFVIFFKEIQISYSMSGRINVKSNSEKQEDDRMAVMATPKRPTLEERVARAEEKDKHAPPIKRGSWSGRRSQEELEHRALVQADRAQKRALKELKASIRAEHKTVNQEHGQGLNLHEFQRQVQPLGGIPAVRQYPPQGGGFHQQTAHSSWNPNTNFQDSEYHSSVWQHLNQGGNYGVTGPSALNPLKTFGGQNLNQAGIHGGTSPSVLNPFETFGGHNLNQGGNHGGTSPSVLNPFETFGGHNLNQGVNSGGFDASLSQSTNFCNSVNQPSGFGIVDESQMLLTNGAWQAHPEETNPSNSAAIDHVNRYYGRQGHASGSGSGYGSGYGHQK